MLDLGDKEAIERWLSWALNQVRFHHKWGVHPGPGGSWEHFQTLLPWRNLQSRSKRATLSVLSLWQMICKNRERPRGGHSIQTGDSGRTSRGFVTPPHRLETDAYTPHPRSRGSGGEQTWSAPNLSSPEPCSSYSPGSSLQPQHSAHFSYLALTSSQQALYGSTSPN